MSEGEFWSDAYAQSSDSNDPEFQRQAAQDAADLEAGRALRRLVESGWCWRLRYFGGEFSVEMRYQERPAHVTLPAAVAAALDG